MDDIQQMVREEVGTAIEGAKDEILSAINTFATETEHRFQNIEGRLDKVDNRLDKVEGRLNKVESDVGFIKERMVTQSVFSQRIDSVENRLIDMM